MEDFANSHIFNWIILPFLIFLARIIDVSIGTMRIMFISRDKKKLAPILGFLEVLVWLIAMRQIFNNLNNVACYIAYASGFATGNYVGMWLEQKLAIGIQVLRIITSLDATNLINQLREEGYGITIVNGQGANGDVKIIFTIIHRKDLIEIRKMVNRFNPKAFYSVEDVRMASEGIFPNNGTKSSMNFWKLMKFEKKAK